MPWSPRNDRPGPRESRGGGGGGGGRPSGLMATGYGSDRRNGGRYLRKQGHPRRSAAISVRLRGMSSSRSCAKPGCNARATDTLPYDYADRTAWLESLRAAQDRTGAVWGKSVAVRGVTGGRRSLQQKNQII